MSVAELVVLRHQLADRIRAHLAGQLLVDDRGEERGAIAVRGQDLERAVDVVRRGRAHEMTLVENAELRVRDVFLAGLVRERDQLETVIEIRLGNRVDRGRDQL